MGVSARFSPSLLHRACLASVEHMRGRPSCRRTDGARRPCAVLTQRSCARGGRVIPRTASDSPRRQRLASGDAAARSRPPPVARCASGGEQVTTAGGKPLRLRAPGKVRDRPGAGLGPSAQVAVRQRVTRHGTAVLGGGQLRKQTSPKKGSGDGRIVCRPSALTISCARRLSSNSTQSHVFLGADTAFAASGASDV